MICVDRHWTQGCSDGGGVYRYIYPPNQSTLNFLCGCFVSLQWLVNIYTQPNQIPGYASDWTVLETINVGHSLQWTVVTLNAQFKCSTRPPFSAMIEANRLQNCLICIKHVRRMFYLFIRHTCRQQHPLRAAAALFQPETIKTFTGMSNLSSYIFMCLVKCTKLSLCSEWILRKPFPTEPMRRCRTFRSSYDTTDDVLRSVPAVSHKQSRTDK